MIIDDKKYHQKTKNKNKNMENINVASLGSLNFDYSGWKYYNKIRKKAMEQEFSWSGLAISLSIAFFIVIAAATSLNLVWRAIDINAGFYSDGQKIYRLETFRQQSLGDYIQTEYISQEKIKNLAGLNLS